MKSWLNKWLGRGAEPYSFNKADLIEITEELKNPVRGWYQLYSFRVEESFDAKAWLMYLSADETGRNDTLVLLCMDLGAYRDKDLDREALSHIDTILSCFADSGRDIILRFSYDFEGKGMEKEPDRFSQVEKHFEQLAPVLEKHRASIYIYQGILVGSWGEMHSSKFLSAHHIRVLEEKLGQMTADIFRAVRRPVFWRYLYSESEAAKAMEKEKVGFYNDAILGSDTDLGTYGDTETAQKNDDDWEQPWSLQKEMSFLDAICRYAPNGGEVVAGEAGREYIQEMFSLEETVTGLWKRHISYLNRGHDSKVLDTWKNCFWEKPDSWNGITGWDYIGRHLGYRFVIRKVEAVTLENHDLCFQIEIENIGFSNLYHEADIFLEYIDSGGLCQREKITCDIRRLDSRQSVQLSHRTKHGEGKYYISMQRKRDNRIIFFGNPADKDGRVFLGEIVSVKKQS